MGENMARYQITVEKKDLREASVEKLVADLKAQGASVSVQKIVKAESRSDRLSEALGELETARDDAVSVVDELCDEIESWKSGLEGTNLENTEKYSQLQECYDALENMKSDIESIDIPDAGDVEFPSMM